MLKQTLVHLFAPQDAPLAGAADFARFYEECHLHVFRYAYALLGGAIDDAEDVTSETFARAWDHRQRFRGDADAALAWVLTIARRRVIDMARRQRRQPLPADLPGPSAPLPVEAAVLAGERSRTLISLLRALPDDQREMLVLRYILGWQVKRVAAHFGKPENTIAVTIRRCLQRLQHAWPHAHLEELQ